MNPTVIEAIGYIGSALVLVSFLMASVVKLRVVNAVGSCIFAIYALIIHSYPTAIMNVCLVLINLYFLYRLRNSEPNYRLVPMSPDDGFISFFLDRHAVDISDCFPGRDLDRTSLDRAFIVCHDDEPAGLLLGREKDGRLDIALDYTTPAYRDSSVGKYLLEHLGAQGISALHYERAEEKHLPYLLRMGYEKNGEAYDRTL